MDWSHRYEDRLREWKTLRNTVQLLELTSSLLQINDWWMKAPLSTQHIAWEDWPDWPNAWELLLDNTWSEMTRSIAIVYTIGLLFREDIKDVYIIDSNEGILVTATPTKYILGYCFGDIQALNFEDITIARTIDASMLTHYRR